ncbi:unnamed protein product [Leuciscus chuanchicus]
MPTTTFEGELYTVGDDSPVLSPLGCTAWPESDPQSSAMLKRAAEAVGLECNPPPGPAQSRLDDWFLGAGRPLPTAPVACFPEMHGELTRSCKAPFTALSDQDGSSPLATLECGTTSGYTAIPPVERSVLAHLCPAAATSNSVEPCFPSQALESLSALSGAAYGACGQAVASMHALALALVPNSLLSGLSIELAVGRLPSLCQIFPVQEARVSIPDAGHPGLGTEVSLVVVVPPLSLRSTVVSESPKGQKFSTLGFKRFRLSDTPDQSGLPQSPCVASWQTSTVQGPRFASSRNQCHQVEAGSCDTYTDPPPDRLRALRVGSLPSTSLPSSWYVSGATSPPGTVSASLERPLQTVQLAPEHHCTRLHDSVPPAPTQIRRRLLHGCEEQICCNLACGNCCPTGEGCKRTGVCSRHEARVLQPLLHCAKERRWIKTNLGPTHLESGLLQAPVQVDSTQGQMQMCPSRRLVCSGRPEGRVLSRLHPAATQAIREVRVRGSGVSVHSPTLWTVSVPPRLYEARGGGHFSLENYLNYLDDWLILAQSREQLCEHRDLLLQHISLLGLQVNWEKSKLSPRQSISFLGVELDSVKQTARLTEDHAQSMLNCLDTFKSRKVVPLKYFQRLQGHMASAPAVTPLGLLHMRPLQHWLLGRVPWRAWKDGRFPVAISRTCRKTFQPWSDAVFLRSGVSMIQASRHAVVFTDASKTGWGAMHDGYAVTGRWTGPQLHWHINCLESDNTTTVSYINKQGGLLNRATDRLSRQQIKPTEWRLHPQSVQLICDRFGAAQLADGSTQVSVSPGEPNSTVTVQSQGGRGAGLASCPLLAQPDLVLRTHTPLFSPSLAHPPEGGPSLSGAGHHLAPTSRPVETPGLVPGWEVEVLRGLPQAVVDTITSARAPSTRLAYASRWNLFVDWCSSHGENPRVCSVGLVLSFLQEGLEQGLSPSTLKVYVASIAAQYDAVGLKFVQKFAVDVTLDPETADPYLILSDDGKQVSEGDIEQDVPENPKRFDEFLCVLAKQGFSSGRFYYEVQVKGKTEWDLGVARESINRKKKTITLSPEDGVWTVVLRNENQYKACESPPVSLSLRVKPEKVGVFVDYEEGLVSFYDVESRSHIYSFTDQTFTDKLYPYFSPGFNDEGKNSNPLIITPVSPLMD